MKFKNSQKHDHSNVCRQVYLGRFWLWDISPPLLPFHSQIKLHIHEFDYSVFMLQKAGSKLKSREKSTHLLTYVSDYLLLLLFWVQNTLLQKPNSRGAERGNYARSVSSSGTRWHTVTKSGHPLIIMYVLFSQLVEMYRQYDDWQYVQCTYI